MADYWDREAHDAERTVRYQVISLLVCSGRKTRKRAGDLVPSFFFWLWLWFRCVFGGEVVDMMRRISCIIRIDWQMA